MPDATLLEGLLGTQRVVPLAEVDDVDVAVALGHVLAESGLPVMEIAFRTDAALPAVEAIRAAVPTAIVGVGTVTTVTQLAQAIAAGGAFVVSPGSTPELLSAAAGISVPFVPGVATVTELMGIVEAGFREAKCFPASAIGGASAIAAFSPVAPGVRFLPTGGIDAETAGAYLQQPSVFAVGGSWVCPRTLIRGMAWEEIGDLARTAARSSGGRSA